MCWVKICGITRGRDAELAVRLGADALGFVFVPSSPRCVSPSEVRAMTRDLGVLTVGVFADAEEDIVRRVADEAELGAVQLHGAESPSECARIDRPVIKAFRVHSAASLARASEYDVHAILADGPGSGRSFDWSLARSLSNVVIAGGLSASNVARAIALSNAVGVDVSSGVESAPGVKDPDQMRAFFEQVQS